MSIFSDHMVDVEKAQDHVFGDLFLITPMKASQIHTGSPDENYPPYTLIGILDDSENIMGVVGTRYKAKVDMNVAGKNSVVAFSKHQLNADKPLPKKDWLIEAVNGPSNRVRVGSVRDDGMGRIHVFFEVAP